MKKVIAIVLTVMLLAMGLGASVTLANDGPPYVTDTPQYTQVKVAQVPIPWQFWAIVNPDTPDATVIDRIRISPTWLVPPEGQPAGDGGVWVRRWWTTVENPLPLEELVWSPGVIPSPDWESDEDPIMIEDGDPATLPVELDLPIPIGDGVGVGAVLVAYTVYKESETDPGVPAAEPEGHFINEAILESSSPQAIVQVLVNFDIHNGTERDDITNFELDFFGLNFEPEDVVWALGFVVGTDPIQLWGANESNPLVVRHIEVTLPDGTEVTGTEVKWVEPGRPLQNCEWLHVGLVFNVDLPGLESPGFIDATVQGYWTVLGWRVDRGTPGYWKNHPDAWPVNEIEIGGLPYSKADAIEILKTPGKGDKTYTMFNALVATMLNVANGTDPSCIEETIDDADTWMGYHPVGSGVKAGGKNSPWRDGEALYELLDEYNNGEPCP